MTKYNKPMWDLKPGHSTTVEENMKNVKKKFW